MSSLTLEEHLAVPYRLVMESFCDADGEWRRRASYPELPGCEVVGDSPVDIIEELDDLRERLINRLVREGRPVPTPRPPLRSRPPVLDKDRLEFIRYLVREGKISEG